MLQSRMHWIKSHLAFLLEATTCCCNVVRALWLATVSVPWNHATCFQSQHLSWASYWDFMPPKAHGHRHSCHHEMKRDHRSSGYVQHAMQNQCYRSTMHTHDEDATSSSNSLTLCASLVTVEGCVLWLNVLIVIIVWDGWVHVWHSDPLKSFWGKEPRLLNLPHVESLLP